MNFVSQSRLGKSFVGSGLRNNWKRFGPDEWISESIQVSRVKLSNGKGMEVGLDQGFVANNLISPRTELDL